MLKLGNIKNEALSILKSGKHYNFSKIAQYLFALLPNQNTYLYEDGSWYTPKAGPSIGWHFDGLDKTNHKFLFDAMVICAVPHPTQFIPKLVKDDLIFSNFVWSDQNVDKYIQDNQLKIFTPNIGDVYLCDIRTLHRMNPTACGHPHLVLRIHLKNKKDGNE